VEVAIEVDRYRVLIGVDEYVGNEGAEGIEVGVEIVAVHV
jgi:hypothetical protein